MKAVLSAITQVFARIGSHIQRLFSTRWMPIPQGTIPLVSWTCLIILGTWYPSTSVLKHFFEGGPLPSGLTHPTGWADNGAMLIIAAISWTWTNLAFVCLASGYLGIAARPDIHTNDPKAWESVLPRAFVVFLACLMQELALRGGLIPTMERMASGDAQQHYLRLAILSSVACFAASFRPAMFDTLVDKIIGQLDKRDAKEGDAAEFDPQSKKEPQNGELAANEVAPKLAK